MRRTTEQIAAAVERTEIPAWVRECASAVLADALMDQYPGLEVIPVVPGVALPPGAVVRPGAVP